MKRKPINERQGKVSEADKLRREADEHPKFVAGEPLRPEGLSLNIRRWWNKCASRLLEEGLLARTDGEVLLKMSEAAANGDDEDASRLTDFFKTRGKVPLPTQPTPKAQPIVLPISITDVAKVYADEVLSGKVIAGKLVIKACDRFLNDLKRTDIAYDVTAAQRVGDYVAALGLQLIPWQAFLIANLFGFKKLDGLRRFTLCYIEVAKKNGKSTLMAALALYMADPEGDGEARGDVYVAATTKYQSKDIVFQEAKRFIAASEAVAERAEVYTAAIGFPGAGKFEPLAANSEKLNGLNIHFGILDEVGDHTTPAMFNVFKSSMVARRQPLLCSITTAGHTRENIAYYQRQHAEQVLEGTIPDDGYFAFIASPDDGDAWDAERTWHKANPSLGVTVQIDRLRSDCSQARNIRSLKADFVRFNVNRWPTTSLSPWIDVTDLSKPGCGYLLESEHQLRIVDRLAAVEKRLAGQRCWAGVDLALVSDLSAVALLFPPFDYRSDDDYDERTAEKRVREDVFELLFRVYCPEENIERRTKEHRVPYNEWREQGLITVTPGEVTDFDFIQRDLLELRERFSIREVGFDVALARDFAGKMEKCHGVKMTQVRQGYGLYPAIQRIEKLTKEGRLCLHGHPIAGWCFSNVVLSHGVKDSRFDRKKSREKIDCAAAAATAVDVWLAAEQANASPYSFRPILSFDNAPTPTEDDDAR
jgi:phage terminase large subunit-like protein